ncbi:MAG: T9SS type A sorting domain-containing protein, partial [Bacteroidales bacterium]|nr:T9SS type A sorting domain-containing protein [Bacteroidales bacterium]
TLSALKVDGDTIDNFAPYRLEYEVILATGTTDVPTVEAITTKPSATAVVTDATEIPGTTTVLVTAADGVTTNTYSIGFRTEASDIANLSDLQVDGETIDGFDPDIYEYNVVLPHGTTVVPTVTATATDMNAMVEITPAPTLPGTTEVLVIAENEITTRTYEVNFTVEVSVGTKEGNAIKVFPTVSDGYFRVMTGGGLSRISVYNLAGVRVYGTETGDPEVQISTPGPGMYILKVENSEMTKIFRIIHSR